MGCGNFADIGFRDHENEPNPFRDQNVRKAFIRKVYLILSAQLLIFIGFVCLFLYCDAVFHWVKEHIYILFIALAIEMTIGFVFCCCGNLRRTPPWNIILLCLFTLSTSFIMGYIAGYYKSNEVLSALGVTAAVCFAITLFAMQTKCDFTICYVGMIIITLIFLLFTMICLFFPDRVLRLIIAAIGVTIFSIWLLIDTQMILGGRFYEIESDEYVFAALCLYCDIIQIFYFILILWSDS